MTTQETKKAADLLRWEQQSNNAEAVLTTIHYEYADGRKITGSYMRENIMLIVSGDGKKWGVRYACAGINPQYVTGEGINRDDARSQAIEAVPQFVHSLTIQQPSGVKRVPVSWGPASGGVIGRI